MTRFSTADADAWYERNKHKLGVGDDPVMKAILHLNLLPKRVLEYGCANGWRLQKISDRFGSIVRGIEISKKAKKEMCFGVDYITPNPPIFVRRNTAAYAQSDLIIHGFNLYVATEQQLFDLVHQTNMLLEDGGHLIIHDFLPEHPYSRIYEHNKELRSRKMDHANLWLAHPGYSMVHRDLYGDGDDRTHVTILKKDMANAFPLVS